MKQHHILNFTDKKIKEKIISLVNGRKENTDVNIVCEDCQQNMKQSQKLLLLIYLQVLVDLAKDFFRRNMETSFTILLLASDINENCELTHLARYNYQLGLDAEFLTSRHYRT